VVGNNGTILHILPLSALSVLPTFLNVAATANSTAIFDINSNISWNLVSGQTWLTLNKTLGSDGAAIIVTALANPDTFSRTSTLIVYGTGVKFDTVIVAQEAGSASIKVSTNILNVASAANSMATFGIMSNINWEVNSKEAWLTTSNASGSDSATITITASANTTINTRIDTITVSGSGVTSQFIAVIQAGVITDIANISNEDIMLYPNPANDRVIIDLQRLNSVQKSNISIYNIQGQTIMQQILQQEKTEIDISGLSKGVYILKVCNGERTEVKKLLKE
jgi:hypothetical protein